MWGPFYRETTAVFEKAIGACRLRVRRGLLVVNPPFAATTALPLQTVKSLCQKNA